jgi:class 3 adenylate cyclase/tetratricopeptide (TPR) repeat protein
VSASLCGSSDLCKASAHRGRQRHLERQVGRQRSLQDTVRPLPVGIGGRGDFLDPGNDAGLRFAVDVERRAQSPLRCRECQHDAPQEATFCPECGSRLSTACTRCGAANAPGHKFCLQCGERLAGAAGPAPAVQPARSPGSHTPRYLAEKVLLSRTALEGERKIITVLFADLKASLELIAEQDPEAARAVLDEVLHRMMDAVHHYEGIVSEARGDGLMALFGAPLAHEDHALRACYAALRMQESVRTLSAERQRDGRPPVAIRVGLSSGEVVVRSIGSDLRMDYSAVGATTHLAGRMEQLAEPGTILLTDSTRRMVEGLVEMAALGAAPVKGLALPLAIFELRGATSARTRLHALAEQGLTEFVGREPQMARLERAVARAAGGQGQVVAVVGEPGIGKSRLLWELTRSSRLAGWRVVEGRSIAYRRATPWLAIAELLRAYLQIHPGDDGPKIREKIVGALALLDAGGDAGLAPLLWVLDVPVDDPDWERLDPPQRRRRALDWVKRLLPSASGVQPLAVVVEDAHWIDAESQAAVDALVSALPDTRMLLLVSYRPEYEHRWSGSGHYTEIRLDPLPPDSADGLLTSLLGDDPALVPLRQQLIQLTEGNPFFLEETVRNLVETGLLAGARGQRRPTRAIDALAIPPTAEAVLAARIDRLFAEDKRLVQAAAVIGIEVPFALLVAVTERDADSVRATLHRLQAAELLYETRLYPELEYTFKHALTQQVAYRSLVQSRRQALHAAVVAAIESRHGDTLSEHTAKLAHHAWHGEVWEKAARYGYEAGRKCLARSAYRDGARALEQALRAASRLPESDGALALAVDIRIHLRGALFPIGDSARAIEYLLEAEPLAQRLGDQQRLGWLATFLLLHLWLEGRGEDARRRGQLALERAEASGDRQHQIATHYLLGNSFVFWSEHARASAHAGRVLDLLGRDGASHVASPMMVVRPIVGALSVLAFAHAERGEFALALRHGERGLRIAEAHRHPFSLVHAVVFLAGVQGQRGDLDQAAALCQRALAIGRDEDVHFLAPRAGGLLGYLQALRGDARRGIATAEAGAEAQLRMGFRGRWAPAIALLADALLLGGELDRARAEAERGLPLAVECEEPATEWRLHRTLGDVAALRDPPLTALAEEHFRRALAIASGRGMRPMIAHSHLSLGRLHQRLGKGGQARDELNTALALYREMDMLFWPDQVEARLRQLGASDTPGPSPGAGRRAGSNDRRP